MEYLWLIISLVANIILLVAVIVLLLWSYSNKSDCEIYHVEWSKWEQRWYEAQAKLLDEHNLFLSLFGSKYGKMSITKHDEEK